jgi:hypothetical protein
MKYNPDFEVKLASYVEGCERIYSRHLGRPCPKFGVDRLQKRIRIISEHSAHSFVDIETGDVLKAAGWKVPAKHARGNIFDESNGLKHIGPFGPAYLK